MYNCRHKDFKLNYVSNNDDGTVDWFGKCETCGVPLTLKNVVIEKYKDGEPNDDGVEVQSFDVKVIRG